MEFRVLGPLEVSDGDAQLALGGPRQRLVLAYLVLEANRVVPTDRLIDRIWDDEPPDGARSALFAYVSRLKKLLGASRIQARAPGYVLVADRAEVDALHFDDLLGEARGQADPGARVQLLADALAMWRGEALSDLSEHRALQPAIARLEEQRLTALEEHAQAQLETGGHSLVVASLEGLVREHPLRERLWLLLMLALYRSGRQGDALAAFHRARGLLADELGIDPSPELQDLHERVLRQDPVLSETLHADRSTRGAAAANAAPMEISGRRRRWVVIATFGAAALLLVGAAVLALRPVGTLPPGAWTLAVDVPLSDTAQRGRLVSNAVQMAVADINASRRLGPLTLEARIFDDHQSPGLAAQNARSIVADPNVVAMIGPWGSSETFEVIPLTNAASMLECGPGATHPGLTKPRYGALDLRQGNGQQVNFIRPVPSDDIQSLALAAFAYRDLGAHSVLVIDDGGPGGRPIADAFENEYRRVGGVPVRRTLNPGDAPASILAVLDAPNPPAVVFVAAQADVAAKVRRAMADGGWLSTPLLGWDALLHDAHVLLGSSGAGQFVDAIGPAAAAGTYAAHASVPDHKFSFADAYRAQFGTEPDEYAAAGYACVEIIAAALEGIARNNPTADRLPNLVRAYAVDTSHRYETVLGSIGFDANGDALAQFVTFYRFDATAAGGAGDWIVFKKQDFGPAP
jgi:DNA-binding SARP family transcriptional activator/ABC-type branched-subunit amino acid transport system substrate-binding protein